MAIEKSLAGGSSDQSTSSDSHRAQQTPNRRRWTDALMHREQIGRALAI